MNRFAEIETFVAVTETGSLSAAAARLGVVVSAISRRMSTLEERLGTPLMTRSSRGASLTSEGRVYYERCLRLIADLAEADALARGDAQVTRGAIRLTCPRTFGVRYLAPLASRFADEHPNLRFELELSDRHADLAEEGFDCAIRIGQSHDPRLVIQPLFAVRYVVAASPAFWEAHGRPDRPRALTDLPALCFRAGPQPAHWKFTAPDGDKTLVRVAPRFVVNDGEFLVEAAKAGLGLILEPSFVCGDAIREGALEPVLLSYRTYERQAELVWPRSRPLPTGAERFAAALRESWGWPAPWDRGIDVEVTPRPRSSKRRARSPAGRR